MNKQQLIAGLLLINLLLSSCTSLRSVIPFPVSISKEACKGKCPVYKVIILKNGEVQFEGIKNTEHIGIKKILLSEKEFQKLKQKYKNIDFSTLKTAYDQRIYDLPKTIIKDNNNSISFKRDQSVPEALKEFVKQIERTLKNYNLI